MYTFLSGEIAFVGLSTCVCNVQGVGYEVMIHAQTAQQLSQSQQVCLYVHQQVREDAHTLYGFLTMHERDLFRMLLQASGVGPKLALTLMAGMEVEALLAAFINKDAALLCKVKGVGTKLAEKMVLELHTKFAKWQGSSSLQLAKPALRSVVDEVVSALVNLGYQSNQVLKVVQSVHAPDMNAEALLKKSLQALV